MLMNSVMILKIWGGRQTIGIVAVPPLPMSVNKIVLTFDVIQSQKKLKEKYNASVGNTVYAKIKEKADEFLK